MSINYKDRLDKMRAFLAEDRIKHGCDYAIAFKYGKAHIVTQYLWEDAIKNAASKFEIEVASFHCYDK